MIKAAVSTIIVLIAVVYLFIGWTVYMILESNYPIFTMLTWPFILIVKLLIQVYEEIMLLIEELLYLIKRK